ncbi:hypothetical protein [Azospirillum argentinense]|uniref:hypothetical protein n=1 Tax=Azospirillum argentinense TaxID=2970906 RepID=UPI0032DFE58D
MLAELAEEEPEIAAEVAARLKEQGEAVHPHPWCVWAWRAWHSLTDDRAWRGGGMGPATPCRIPWLVIVAYADRHGHDADQLLKLIHAMDEVFLDWMAEQIKASQKKDGTEPE